MKHITRILSAILLFAMMVTLLACAKSGGGDTATTPRPDTTAPANTIQTELEELDLPSNLDYDGKTVTFLSTPKGRIKGQIYVEELGTNKTDDAIFYRNAEISDTLNVEIKEIFDADISALIAAGDDTVDIYASNVCDHALLIQQGYFYNLMNMENLDLDKQWWYQDWINEAMMGDRLYFVTGALSLSLYRLMYAVFFNKKLVNDVYASTSADPVADLFKTVEDGKWTIDYMTQFVSKGYQDLNGNSDRDSEDIYGYGTNTYSIQDHYWSSLDLNFIDKTENGDFTLNPTTEKIYNAYDKIYYLIYNNGAYIGKDGSVSYDQCCDMFAAGSLMTSTLRLSIIESEAMRNMSDDYGIIPTPKYDETQTEYHSYAQDQYTTFSIPIYAPDPECSAAVLELMSYLSYKDVVPAYFDGSLKGQYSSDPITRLMLDLVKDGLFLDAGWIYTKLVNQVCAEIIRGAIGSKSTSIASIYEKYETSLKRALPYFLKTYEELEY